MGLLHLEGGAFETRVEGSRDVQLRNPDQAFLYQGNCPPHDVRPTTRANDAYVAVLPDTSACRRSMRGVIARGSIALPVFRSNSGCILVSSKCEHSTEFLECASGTYKELECESEAGYAVIPGPL